LPGNEDIHHITVEYMLRDKQKTEWKWFAENWRELCQHANIVKQLAIKENSQLSQPYVSCYR